MRWLDIVFRDRSLGYKFIILTSIPALVITVLIVTVSLNIQYGVLEQKSKKRAVWISNQTALMLSNDFVIYNKDLLNNIVDNLEVNTNVVYAMIVDTSDDRVLAHSDHDWDGRLLANGQREKGESESKKDDSMSYELSKDIEFAGNTYGKLTIGFSVEEVHREIKSLTMNYLWLVISAIGVGALALIFLARMTSAPIKLLVQQARIAGSGNLDAKVTYQSKDILGDLADAFNQMIVDLKTKHQQVAESEAQLARRNRELEILYTIQTLLSKTRNLDTTLSNALTSTIEQLNMDMGGVYVNNEEKRSFEFRAHYGTSDAFAKQISQLTVDGGISLKAVEQKRVQVIHTADHPHPGLRSLLEKMEVKTSAIIPLLSGDKVLGTITISSRKERVFSEEDFNLMIAIGRTIGIYISNAKLYEQVINSAATLEIKVLDRTVELETAQEKMVNLVENLKIAKGLAEDKAEELEAFCYSISHDLKAPLRGIEGYSQLLEEEYKELLDEQGCLFLRMVRQSVGKMDQLIDDLLTYSRLDRMEINLQELDLAKLVDEVLQSRASGHERQPFATEINLEVTRVISETNVLRHVFANLFDNAIKFSANATAPVIRIDTKETGGEWVFTVSDNGIGFDMKYHDRIFLIFQRLEKSEVYPGTGVGLAIVKKMLDRLGGRVWAEAILGEGTSVHVALPIGDG